MEEILTGLLAQVAGGRRHWTRAPQGTALPYVVMHRISTVRSYHTQGQTSLVETRVQIDVYAETYAAMRSVADHIRNTFSGYRGQGLEAVFIDSDRDLSEADAGDVVRLFRRSIDIIVHHKEG